MPNEKSMNVTIQDAAGRCIGNGRMACDLKVIHSPKILLRFCYHAEKPDETLEQLKNLMAGKTGKSAVSIFIGKIAFRNLLITDCGFSVNELDGLDSPVLNRIMVQAESNRATTKNDMDEIYP
jgi:hypothetical protein